VFSEVLDVRVVNVEVVVTDGKGNRVSGLTAEDFRLLIDGEETTIDYFSEIFGGRVTTPVAEGEPALPGALEPGQEVGTSFLVFVDDQFTIARDRNRVLKRIEEDLGRLGRNDRMAIVAFDGRQLEMLTSWTNSERALSDAFRDARERKAFGLQLRAELRTSDRERRDRVELAAVQDTFIRNAGGEPAEDFGWRLDPVELNYAQRLEDQVGRSISAAVASLRGFASPPGRKVMMLLSGGWPYSPAQYTVADFEASIETAGHASLDSSLNDGRGLLGQLSQTANLLGYTLYPVDVPGAEKSVGVDVSVGAPDGFSGAGAPSIEGGLFLRENLSEETLRFLADETGGEALLNAQRDAAFELVVSDTRSYYWLGFNPNRREDDEGHDIKIEVLDKSLTVRSRRGFLDLSRQSESTMMVESSLFFGNPPTGYPLDLRFGQPSRAGRGKVEILMTVGIPMDHVTLIPTQGRLVADLEIRVTVMDEHGTRSETPMDTIHIEGTRPPRPGQRFTYETDVTMRRRKSRIAVAVVDPVSGTTMSSIGEIDP
jgi:VWFA-related protein